MPVVNISKVVVATADNTPAIFVDAGDTLNLSRAGALIAVGAGAFSRGIETANAVTLNIFGDVYSGQSDGIQTFSGSTITINADASVFGVTGIEMNGASMLTNSGTISGQLGVQQIDTGVGTLTLANLGIIRGVVGVTSGSANATIGNSGNIEGTGAGIQLLGAGTNVYNMGGLIRADTYGINGFGVASNFNLFNTGTIVGTIGVLGSNAGDNIVNTGLIHSTDIQVLGHIPVAVSLNGGNDVYDGRNGRVFGLIDGGAGDDVILGGLEGEAIMGGDNVDQLHGNGGNDALVGGSGADSLFGGEGADRLFGQNDGDVITGGAGGDIIMGGLGADFLVFNVGDNGDLIQGFNEGGIRDRFDLRGYFDATGFTGSNPRAAGILQVLQNGADTDVYLHGAFAFRIQGVVAAAIDDTYFLFQ